MLLCWLHLAYKPIVLIKKVMIFIHVSCTDRRWAGVCNPLDCLHHAKTSDTPPYREGVVIDKPAKKGRCLVDVGLHKEVSVEQKIQPGMRVTVKMDDAKGDNEMNNFV